MIAINTEVFKQAHLETKSIVQKGDSYRAVFAAVLREIYAKLDVAVRNAKFNSRKNAMGYRGFTFEQELALAISELVARISYARKSFVFNSRNPNCDFSLNAFMGLAEQAAAEYFSVID